MRQNVMATNFMAKFGYMRSFGRLAFENGLQYHHSYSKISNGDILAIILCKYDENRSSNPRDNKGRPNKCTFLDETAKIGISHRISQQLLDQSSPTFQSWYGDYKTDISFAVVQVTVLW